MKNQDRNKAWIGAVIGVASSIAGGLIKKNAQNKAAKEQELAANRKAALESANNLTQAYSDQTYTDDYNKKLTMRTGGRFRGTQVSHAKKYSCGGRKKATAGVIQPLDPTKLVGNSGQGIASTPKVNTSTKLNITPQQPQQPQVSTGMSALGQEALGAGIGALGNLASAYIMSKAYKCGGKYKTKRR